jgi:hypothetical protein
MRKARHKNYSNGKVWQQMREVFKEFRKRGFIARMNFKCCSTCASYDLAEMMDKDNKIKYAIYWHRQVSERYKESGSLDLHYFGKDNLDTEAADIIIEELQKADIVFSWNGNTDKTIEVFDDEFTFKRIKGTDTIPGLIIEGE